MTKYTINKVLEKDFLNPVWKIEVDYINNNLAVECRNPQDTQPTFHIYSFEGKNLLEDYSVTEKEWTLEAVQNDYLILKKLGINSPIQAGIQIIHIPTKTIVATFAEYILKEVRANTIIAVHRSIPSGLIFYIDITTGHVNNKTNQEIPFPDSLIEYPQEFRGNLPVFLQDITYEGHIWLQSCSNYFIWTFLQKTNNHYDQHVIISSKNQVFKHIVVLNNLNKLILQPYFKVKDNIFFLSDTKQKIVTYLVLL